MKSPDRIILVHITDTHFGEAPRSVSKDKEAVARKVYENRVEPMQQSLYDNLRILKRNNDKSSAAKVRYHVVITGDFLQTYGSRNVPADKDYTSPDIDKFRDFLTQIAITLDIDHNNFVFCLGNQDRNRAAFKSLLKVAGDKETFNGTLARLKKEATEKDLDETERERRKKIQTDFRKTEREPLDNDVIELQIKEVEKGEEGEIGKKWNGDLYLNPYKLLKGCAPPNFRGTPNYMTGIKTLDGIDYLVFNTAWLCGDDIGGEKEDGNLTLGRAVTLELLQEYRNGKMPQFTVGLMHHGFNSLHFSNYLPLKAGSALSENENPDPNTSISSQIYNCCQLLLQGHEHGEVPVATNDNTCYAVKAGSFMSEQDLKGHNVYSIYEIDLSTEKIKKTTYQFDGNIWPPYPAFDFDLKFPAKTEWFTVQRIEQNEYFGIQKNRVLAHIENNKPEFIGTENFLSEGFNWVENPQAPTIIFDDTVLTQTITLTDYREKHSFRRARVLKKIKEMGWQNKLKLVELLEIMNYPDDPSEIQNK